MLFHGFFEALKRHKVPVSLTEWMVFLRALEAGLAGESLPEFYFLARGLLVKSEHLYDRFDQAFLEYFAGVEAPPELAAQLLEWLEQAAAERPFDLDRLRALPGFERFEDLLREFEARLAAQQERHDYGSQWIGTRGTSPFGHSGRHDAGIRIGGAGGRRSAVQVAQARRFRNYRRDLVLDTRQLRAALNDLRVLAREGAEEELDLDETIDRTAQNGGEIELAWHPSRRNAVRLLLLMDVGGSMTPHARLVSLLFSAAHASAHFRDFQFRYFHNCVYDQVYADIERRRREGTAELLRRAGPEYRLLMVGDACMAPYELTAVGGAIDYWEHNRTPGVEWLRRLARQYPHRAWLNPDPRHYWDHFTVRAIGALFPMFELTLDGLGDAVRHLRAQPGEGRVPV